MVYLWCMACVVNDGCVLYGMYVYGVSGCVCVCECVVSEMCVWV